jgi:hypothetical protein
MILAMRYYAANNWLDLLRYAEFRALKIHYLAMAHNEDNLNCRDIDRTTIEQWGADIGELAYSRFATNPAKYADKARLVGVKVVWRGLIRDRASRYIRSGANSSDTLETIPATIERELSVDDYDYLGDELSVIAYLLAVNPGATRAEIAELLGMSERTLRSRIAEIKQFVA